MSFATFNGGQVVNTAGQPELLFLLRSDANELDYFNFNAYAPFVVYTDKFDIGEAYRGGNRRPRKIIVHGTGTVSAGSTITIATDLERGEIYPCSPGNVNKQILVYQECSALVGELITVTLFLVGTAIKVTNIELDYVPIS